MSAVRPDEVLVQLPDGTTKQRNPFTGTRVWTVPGRGNRPIGSPAREVRDLVNGEPRSFCAFCQERYLETPPEKARLVSDGVGHREVTGLLASQVHDSVAEFRRIPNLFEIQSLDYWRLDHGFEPSSEQVARARKYIAEPEGLAHLRSLVATRAKAAGAEPVTEPDEVLATAMGWFASGHELIVPRRHFVDGATTTAQLASSGCLSPEEHRAYLAFTLASMAQLYSSNPYVRYVAVFQNWLKPAGSSFDHLHKQLVAIDEHGSHTDALAAALARDANACNDMGLDIAIERGLLLAENEHAVAWVGFGHRYPTVEVWSLSSRRPWSQDEHQVAGMSDLVHALHAAAGPDVPCNEEWVHRPPDLAELVPWRILIKWRISTLAGFEGATRIYLNTISPWAMRDRLLPRLRELREQGRIADVRLGDECRIRPGSLPTNHG